MQGYKIAANMSTDLNRDSKKSDIHSYMALAELLGLVDAKTASDIIELGTDNGLRSIRAQGQSESLRRERLTDIKKEFQKDRDQDINQDWSTVM